MTEPPRGTGLGKRLASNALSSAAGRVVVLVMWLVLTPPLVRALGPDAFGIWSLFYALSFWLLALDLGLSQIALRFVAAARAQERPEEGGAYATLALIGYAAIGAVWFLLTPLVTPPALQYLRVPDDLAHAASWAMVASAWVFLLAGTVQTFLAVLQAHERFDLAAWGLSITAILQGSGIALGLMRGEGLGFMIAAVVAGWLAGTILCFALLRVGAPGFALSSPLRAMGHWREALAFGGPVQAANLLAVTHQQADKFLLARLVALAAVTPYELGMRIASATASFPQFLMLAIHPTATGMYARGDHAGLAHLYRRTTRWVLAASAMLAAVLVGGAGPLLSAWLSAPSPEAALALQGLALAAFAASPAGTTSIMARASNRPGAELEWSATALIVHLAIALVAIPKFGLMGALAATLIANAVSSTWFVLRLGRTLGLPAAQVLGDTFGLALLAVVVGVAAAMLLDRAVPAALGAQTWWRAAAVSGTAGGACAVVMSVVRFVDFREAWSLVRAGGTR